MPGSRISGDSFHKRDSDDIRAKIVSLLTPNPFDAKLPGFSEIPPLHRTAPGAVIWHDFPIYRPWVFVWIIKNLERREDHLDFPKYRPWAVI